MTTTPAASSLDDLLATRWSCREFRPDSVPQDVIEEVLTLAGRTPSWCNVQPWHVHVTTGSATKRFRQGLVERVLADPTERPDLPFPPGYEGLYRDRRRECGWQLYDSVGVERGDRDGSARQMLRNFELFGAPHVAIVTTDAGLGVYGAVDCGLFLDSLLLALHSWGLGAVPQAALAGQSSYVREFFDLPDDRLVLAGVSFGYAVPEAPVNGYRTSRQPLEQLATFVTA